MNSIKYKGMTMTMDELRSHKRSLSFKISLHYEERGVQGANIGYIEYLDAEIERITTILKTMDASPNKRAA
jgi:hypothetical protein